MRIAVLMLMIGLAGSARGDIEPDAVVDPSVAGSQPSGPGSSVPVFASIAAALSSATEEEAGPYRVLIRKGVYREKLRVTRPDVHLLGETRDGTVITWDDTGSTPGPGGEGLGTWGSATLTVLAPGFQAENLTVANGFDYPANAALAADDPRRVERMQAVALMTTGDSDRAVFDRVTVVGYQDTLFVDAGRSYFRDCKVLGHVDFIFGAGQAVFENCDIVSRNRANKNPTGYVTAPSTHVAQPYGLLFINSRLLKEDPHLPAGSVRLGRPWHPGAVRTAEGSAVFINCFMDDHIGREGYAPISAVDSNGVRVWFEVDERSRFFEFGSHGPGGAPSEYRPQLTPGRAEWFSSDQALNGWNPFGQ